MKLTDSRKSLKNLSKQFIEYYQNSKIETFSLDEVAKILGKTSAVVKCARCRKTKNL